MKFCWIDLEMTGLDEKVHHILEVALIVTNISLDEICCYHECIYQSEEVLNHMNDWSREHHAASGLLQRVKSGKELAVVECEILNILEKTYIAEEPIYLAGNSIAQDRRFIDRYLPRLSERLHYRMLDVSSFKLIYEGLFQKQFEKQKRHLALDDIKESIEELRFYLDFIPLERHILG